MQVLVLPGDGIGPEIASATEAVLMAADRAHGLGLKIVRDVVGFESLDSHGVTLREGVIERARKMDGVILGPVSTSDYPPRSEGGLNPSAEFRKRLDLYANVRPCRTLSGLRSTVPGMDLIIVRENTEGFYADRTMTAGSGEFMPTPDVALAVRKITREGARRVLRLGFELASERRGHMSVVHKANVLSLSDGLFLNTARELAAEFPDLILAEVLVDAMAALLVRTPEAFDVVVTTNMFGDILSNEAAELAGGLGLAASLNLGDHHVVAQAAHGSAPDLEGSNQANPAALIRSAAMLLGHLGRVHGRPDLEAAAQDIDRALNQQLVSENGTTPELGGTMTTSGFAAAVAERIS